MARKLAVALAVRNAGTRLFGKPLQNLSVESTTSVLKHIVDCLNSIDCIDEVVLGISEGIENRIYIDVAAQLGIRHIIGNEDNVLGRLVSCGELAGATDILRVTSESPFMYWQPLEDCYAQYCAENADGLFYDDIIDGCGFEIVSLAALKTSLAKASKPDHLEHCTMYLRENNVDFKLIRKSGPDHLNRKDLRLTVDNPEDLAVCRHVYAAFADQAPRISVDDIVGFLDNNPALKDLIAPFTEVGYETMYIWGKTHEH